MNRLYLGLLPQQSPHWRFTMANPLHSRVLSVLDYNPLFPHFYWRKTGRIAGSICPRDGYIRISVDKNSYKGHRLAIFYVTGEWPNGPVDHKNRVRSDNRYSNLRVVSHSVNLQNSLVAKSNNKSCGLLGVNRDREKWQARIRYCGRRLSLGSFATAEQAHDAYLKAKSLLHDIGPATDLY
jgi:hypothetical protein